MLNTQQKLELVRSNDIACITPQEDGSFHLTFMCPTKDKIVMSSEEMNSALCAEGVSSENHYMIKLNLMG